MGDGKARDAQRHELCESPSRTGRPLTTSQDDIEAAGRYHGVSASRGWSPRACGVAGGRERERLISRRRRSQTALQDEVDMATFTQIAEIDDSGSNTFCISLYFDFFGQAEDTFKSMRDAL